MKHFLLIILLLELCSCSIVDVEDYVHEPTHKIRNSIVHWKYQRVAELTKETFLMVPNLREFSKSFSYPSGKLYVLAKTQRKVFIESVSLRSESKPEVLINVNKISELNRALKGTQYYSTNIVLFNSDNFPIEKWNSEPIIWLTIKYSENEGEIKVKSFKIEHEVFKEVAWST